MKYVLYAVLFFLSACAPTTVAQLRADAAGVHSFKVDGDYQAAYQRALAHARTCYQQALSGMNTKVRADLYPERKSSTISIVNVHAIGTDTLFAIDIAQAGPDKTQVSVYYAMRQYRPTALIIGDWISEDSNECQPVDVTVKCVCYLTGPY